MGSISTLKIVRNFTKKITRDATKRNTGCCEHEAQLALFVEQVPAAMAMFDGEMRYLAVSRKFLSIFGFSGSPTEVIGRSHYETVPDIPSQWRKLHARVLTGEELAQAETPILRRDGRTDWVHWSMKPWRTSDGRIGGALLAIELITAQVEARQARAETEARFRATFENAAVGIAHVTPNGRWLRVNEAMCRILGWPADELVTRSFQDLTQPDDLAAEVPQVEQLREGKINSYGMDKRTLRGDGSFVWIHRTVSCVRRGDGAIDYFISVVEDISARKRAEEQINLLMQESNHRAKNMLGLVQAIARHISCRGPEEFFERFGERIQALAANQDLLIRNEWQGAPLEDLVRAQLAHFADLIESRIAVSGEELHLNPAAAQAIGLALHELATNAVKYGALSTDAGRVDVVWRLDGDIFAMSWKESNGPPVRPPERRGFGDTVINSMVRGSVGGEVQLGYASSGLEWRLTCPAVNALERRRMPVLGEGPWPHEAAATTADSTLDKRSPEGRGLGNLHGALT